MPSSTRAGTRAASPKIHIARSKAKTKDGEVTYAYLRYSVWDERKGRLQPKPLAGLGRTDDLDPGRVESLEGFLKEWLRKDSSLPFEALQDRFRAAEPNLRILCSRDFGLRWVMEQAWCELGYDRALAKLVENREHGFRVDVAIFAMVLVQLIAPQSKRALARWQGANLFLPEAEGLTGDHFYAALDVLAEGQDLIEAMLSESLKAQDVETTRVLHDTTTIPFAIRYDDVERKELSEQRESRTVVNEPPLRLRGHSKNKRRDLPQVVLEAVSNEHGILIHHRVHPGNTGDAGLTAETAQRLHDLGYRQVEWAGDSGMNSARNRQALRSLDFEFVLGEGVSRTNVVKAVLRRGGAYRQHPERPELSYKCVIAEATDEARGREPVPVRLYVIRRNAKEETHALCRIERHLAKVEATLAEGSAKEREALLHHQTYRKYVRPDLRGARGKERAAGKVVLDAAKVAQARKLAGRSVIATDDLGADPITKDEVYRSLFDLEAIFRQLKSTLKVGPIRHRRADRIQAHVMVAVMARNVAAWLEHKSGMTFEALRAELEPFRVQEVVLGAERYWQCVEPTPAQVKLIRGLGFSLPPTRFTVTPAR